MKLTNGTRFLGAFLVSIAWVGEFRAECHGQARYRWWVGDPLAAMNSFVASALDYIVGFFVLLASVSNAFRSGLVATIEPLVIGQSALETKYPSDIARACNWDFKFASWVGHFGFSLFVISLIMVIVRSTRLPLAVRAFLGALLLVPFIAIYFGGGRVDLNSFLLLSASKSRRMIASQRTMPSVTSGTA